GQDVVPQEIRQFLYHLNTHYALPNLPAANWEKISLVLSELRKKFPTIREEIIWPLTTIAPDDLNDFKEFIFENRDLIDQELMSVVRSFQSFPKDKWRPFLEYLRAKKFDSLTV